ncbi:hypothetical protein Syun_004193 [Stephania yunnanensis]|uniref:Uncharacterized protein n=1 Tax=Stephania yunnanensis TaxID=152371 RepID=A0AAP0L2V8_9MAGN
MNIAGETSPADQSASATLYLQGSPNAKMEFASSSASEEKTQNECQNKDSDIGNVTRNVYNEPKVGLDAHISAENAEKVGNKHVFVEAGSSGSHDYPTAIPLENLSSMQTDSPIKSKSGDYINIAKVQSGDGMSPRSPESRGARTTGNIPNYSPREQQKMVTASASTKGLKTIDRLEHEQINAVGVVDTTAPIESVKEAVSKFGGILDWKEHKIQTVERQKSIQKELQQVQEESFTYNEQLEEAEDEKSNALNELNSTKRLVEELKLSVEQAELEERQVKQDSELIKLRVEEMERGIAHEASVAAKAQFEVARERNAAANAELKAVKDELKKIQAECDSLTGEKKIEAKRAEEALSASTESEKSLEETMLELIATKKRLESAEAMRLEAEDQRTLVAMSREEDSLAFKSELKQAEEVVNELNQQILSRDNLKLKLNTAEALLLHLKAELKAYSNKGSNKGSSVEEGSSRVDQKEPWNETQLGFPELNISMKDVLKEAITSTTDAVEEIKLNTEKARAEVNQLTDMSESLKSEIEKENSELADQKQSEGKFWEEVASLEAELNNIKAEVALIQMKEKEVREKALELPDMLRQAAKEADQTKSLADSVNDELVKAKQVVEQVQDSASTIKSKLNATQKEIEAATASERLVLGVAKTLEKNDSIAKTNGEDSTAEVSLTLKEQCDLSKRVHDAVEQDNLRVAAQLEMAKESEHQTMDKLEEVCLEMAAKKVELQNALEKAEKAEEEKLGMEQELRNWRSDHEQQRLGNEVDQEIAKSSKSPTTGFEHVKESKSFASRVSAIMKLKNALNMFTPTNTEENEPSQETKLTKKKKRSWFPRIVLFFSKKRVQEH